MLASRTSPGAVMHAGCCAWREGTRLPSELGIALQIRPLSQEELILARSVTEASLGHRDARSSLSIEWEKGNERHGNNARHWVAIEAICSRRRDRPVDAHGIE